MRIFITATDTNVGKTFISYNLFKALKEKDIKVKYFKPIETGVISKPEDASLMCSLSKEPLENTVFYTFKNPVSPYAASIMEQKEIDLNYIFDKIKALEKGYDIVLIEGAGGLSVPILKDYDFSDFAKDLSLELLIVARATLGTLNHTYLTYFYAKQKDLNVKSIVLNGFTKEDPSEKLNPLIIEERTKIKPVLINKNPSLKEFDELLKALNING